MPPHECAPCVPSIIRSPFRLLAPAIPGPSERGLVIFASGRARLVATPFSPDGAARLPRQQMRLRRCPPPGRPAGLAPVVGAARDDSAILEIPGEEHAHRNRKYGEHDDEHRLSKRGEQKRQHAQNRGRNRGGHVQRRKRLRRCVEVDAYGRKKAATNKAAMTMVRAATMVLARAVPAISLFSST